MPGSGDAALLARFGFRTPERARTRLPEGWRDDSRWHALLQHFGDAADPDAALLRLGRLGTDVIEAALRKPASASRLLHVIGYSDYLTELLERTPGLAQELLGDEPVARTDVRGIRDAGFVHIASEDLMRTPDRDSFAKTARALSDLSDVCVAQVLSDVAGGLPLAVLGMGKYGAQELNYASDIDLLFVLGDAEAEGAERNARRLMEAMNGPPVLFRVDADLRPEGRDGPLVRSLAAYDAYYSRWAQVWEFQALIKCRFVAGDQAVGSAFMEMIDPRVWPDTLAPEAIEQVRAMKSRAEQEIERRGLTDRQVKLGSGGIRDVEFAVQLLQLVHGRHNPDLRVRGTLEALDVLGADGYVAEDDVRELVDAYVFLRHTEHRLQLEAGRQTHTLPRAPGRREHLARGLGFRDGAGASALEAFERAWTRTTSVVRTIHERLFYRPLMESFAAVPSVRPTLPPEEVDERLAVLGFDRPPRVREAIASLTSGGTRRGKMMRAILPGLLSWMAETPEADAGMLRLVVLAQELDALPHLLAMLRDEPPVAELVCRALGTGPVLAGLLQGDPSLLAALSGDQSPTGGDRRAHALALIGRAAAPEAAVGTLRRFKEGEFLRLATRDLTSGADPAVFVDIAAGLSNIGDACLDAALALAVTEQSKKTGGPPPGDFTIVGMGRLGGGELNYASDLDVMFVYERDGNCPDGSEGRLFHTAVAEAIIKILGSTPPIFKVDTELRPEGRSGPIVRSLQSYLLYYQRWASLWEFQALTRARHSAGDRGLTTTLLDAVAPRVWRPKLEDADVAEIRHMKARIERERVPRREDPRYQVKLGVGGLADVEFTVQLLQMQHGYRYPALRTPNTLRGINALEGSGLIEPQDAQWLREAYLLLNRVRNHLFLLRGLATDALPTRDEEMERLARSLGYGRLSRSKFLERYKRVTRRARRVTDRLFYGEGS
ncbi:MAG: bifunctional [glutamine synthetase] adenylyltransferase/[glutamine synthetase]-adenylyl-L-tyrosine phosphorylase [Actinomycetota bacterium]